MNQGEFAQRAWAVWRRKVPTLPAFTDCRFEFGSPDETVSILDRKGRKLGACRLVHTTKGARVCAISKEHLDNQNPADYTQEPSALAKQGDTTTATHNYKTMKLRFDVNQAECFRRGINHTTSTATLEVDPSKLDQPTRDLIASRLDGIDVAQLRVGEKHGPVINRYDDGKPARILAATPSFESLMEAIKADQARLEAQLAKD